MTDYQDELADDRYGYFADDCDHEDADFDILDGRLHCHCGYSRHLSAEEVDSEIRRMSEYDDLMRAEERRAFWRNLSASVRGWLRRLLHFRLPKPKPKPVIADDEIPF